MGGLTGNPGKPLYRSKPNVSEENLSGTIRIDVNPLLQYQRVITAHPIAMPKFPLSGLPILM